LQPSSGSVGIGTSSPTETLDVAGNASVSGTLAFHAGTGTIQTTTFSPLVLGGSTTGNITLNPSNAVAGGNISPAVTNVTDLGTASLLYRNIYGTTIYQGTNQVCDVSGNCTAGTDVWNVSNGAYTQKFPNQDVLLGVAAGVNATASAKFAFMNINSPTLAPTASIAGTLANVATFIDGNGNIATTNTHNLTLGNSATYPTGTGNILLNPNGTGFVGIGTTSPGTPLQVNATTTDAYNGILKLVSSSSTEYAGITLWNGTTSVANDRNWQIANNYQVSGNLDFMRSTTNTGNPTTAVMSLDKNGNVGIGVTSPAAKLDVLGNINDFGSATVSASYAAGIPLTVKGATSQTADIAEFQNSTGSIQASIDSAGNILAGDLYLTGASISNDLATTDHASIIFPQHPDTTTDILTTNTLTNGDWSIVNDTNTGGALAALTVNQKEAGPLLQVQKTIAGPTTINEFQITSAGNATESGDLSLGGQLQVGRFAANPTSIGPGSVYFNTTSYTGNYNLGQTAGQTGSLFVQGEDNAWHRIATDMTEYSTGEQDNIPGVLGGSTTNIITLTHANQATNEVDATGWFQTAADAASGIWENISSWTNNVINALDNTFNPAFTQKMKTTAVAMTSTSPYGNGADGAIDITTSKNINTQSAITGRVAG
jgi:hypothetical protein